MVGILSLLPLFVCLFVCTVTDLSAAEKDSVVKLVRLLSGTSFSHFGEHCPRGGSRRSLTRGDVAFLGLGRAKIANKSQIAENCSS